MNCFAYRIHYQDDPRRIGHIPMNSDEVVAALRRFRDALPQYLQELNASGEVPEPPARQNSAIRVIVRTELDWAKAALAMTGYADRHGLRATHVAKGPLPAQARGGARPLAAWSCYALGGRLAAGK